MIDRKDTLAPENVNDEQEDEDAQAQEIAEEALRPDLHSPLDSEKVGGGGKDLIDEMRDMEQSGRIDMSAYRGEPNMDDEDDKYGRGHDPDED
ncbi:hypothetical protein [Tsuneonella sp. HG222]